MLQDKYRMTQENNVLFAKRNLVDSIYKEAKLEGIGVTFSDTYEIFNGRVVPGLSLDDTIKINNLKRAWQFVFDTLNYPIDLRYIRQINSEIGKGVVFKEGMLRDSEVRIGGTSWKPDLPNEDNINIFINDVTNNLDLSATERAIETLLYLMRCQIFYDGNKRTAQLIANKIMIESGAGIISIPVEQQHPFLEKLITFYETGEQSDISTFLYTSSIDGVNSVPLERQEEILELD